MEHLTTNVLIDPKIWKQFKMINIHRQEKIGECLGRIVTEEVKKNIKLLNGGQA